MGRQDGHVGSNAKIPETPKLCFGLVRGSTSSLRGTYMTVVIVLSPQAVVSVQIPCLSVRKEKHSLCTGIRRSSAALCISAVSPSWGSVGVMCEEALGETLALGVSGYTVWA